MGLTSVYSLLIALNIFTVEISAKYRPVSVIC
jgi:hypothetical protein